MIEQTAHNSTTNITDPESVLTLALADMASLGDLLALHEGSGHVPDKGTITQAGNMIRKAVKDAQEVVDNHVRYEQPKAEGGAS